MTGEITYETLSIESGAQFEGQCKSRPYKKT
jgi:cytoskeletal protein CcmA (bactofilin family)